MYCYLKINFKPDTPEEDIKSVIGSLKDKKYNEKDFVARKDIAAKSTEIYVRCLEIKKFEIFGFSSRFFCIKNIEEVKTNTEYHLYACGITEQKGTAPYHFAAVPIALIETYYTKPDKTTLFNRFKNDEFCVDGYMLIETVTDACHKNVVLKKKTLSVFTDVEEE